MKETDSSALSIPAGFEPFFVDDSLRELAYERLHPEKHGILKQVISYLYAAFGNHSRHRETVTHYEAFAEKALSIPADFALCVCPVTLEKPFALLAAVLPAVLAGVQHIFPCFILPESALCSSFDPQKYSASDAHLTSLDLAGIEQAFALGGKDLLAVLPECAALGHGRLVILGAFDGWEALLVHASNMGITTQTYIAPSDTPKNSSDSSQEFLWPWPELCPQWFCKHTLSFSPW